MRAQKNPIEQKGMERAHIVDGVAMCDALSLLERRVCKITIYHFKIDSPHQLLKIISI